MLLNALTSAPALALMMSVSVPAPQYMTPFSLSRPIYAAAVEPELRS